MRSADWRTSLLLTLRNLGLIIIVVLLYGGFQNLMKVCRVPGTDFVVFKVAYFGAMIVTVLGVTGALRSQPAKPPRDDWGPEL